MLQICFSGTVTISCISKCHSTELGMRTADSRPIEQCEHFTCLPPSHPPTHPTSITRPWCTVRPIRMCIVRRRESEIYGLVLCIVRWPRRTSGSCRYYQEQGARATGQGNCRRRRAALNQPSGGDANANSSASSDNRNPLTGSPTIPNRAVRTCVCFHNWKGFSYWPPATKCADRAVGVLTTP